jgi:nicotinamide riboside transporter PnuC
MTTERALIEVVGLAVTFLAVGGAVLNNRRLRACFWLWLFSNAASAAIHVTAGLWSLAARDVIFFALAIEGLWRWRQERPSEHRTHKER